MFRIAIDEPSVTGFPFTRPLHTCNHTNVCVCVTPFAYNADITHTIYGIQYNYIRQRVIMNSDGEYLYAFKLPS